MSVPASAADLGTCLRVEVDAHTRRIVRLEASASTGLTRVTLALPRVTRIADVKECLRAFPLEAFDQTKPCKLYLIGARYPGSLHPDQYDAPWSEFDVDVASHAFALRWVAPEAPTDHAADVAAVFLGG